MDNNASGPERDEGQSGAPESREYSTRNSAACLAAGISMAENHLML